MAMRPRDDYDDEFMKAPIPERFIDADADSRQARAGHRLRSIVTIAVAVVAVGAIVAAGLHFLGGRKGGGMGGVPVIKADDKPIKMRPPPGDRGGMQVPNQDKLVYERMEQGPESEPKVERLLPQAEAPKAPPRQAPAAEPVEPAIPLQPAIQAQPQRPTAPLPPKAGEPPNPKAAPTPKVAAPVETPPPSTYQPVQTRPAAKDQVITPAQAASAPPPPPAPAAPAAPKAAAATAGDYVIQLGAVRAQDLAEKEWARIQKANGDLLGALRPDIVRVELEGKGVFWRIRAAPLSETSARQICAELAQRSQGCIVARK